MLGKLFGGRPKDGQFDWVNDLPPVWEEVASVDHGFHSVDKIFVDASSCFKNEHLYFGKMRVSNIENGKTEQSYLLCIADFGASMSAPKWQVLEVLAETRGKLTKHELEMSLQGIDEFEIAIKQIRVFASLFNYTSPPPYVTYILQKY